MNTFLLGLFLLISVTNGLPIEKNTPEIKILDAIKEKCSPRVVKPFEELKELKPLQECPLWHELIQTDKLTRSTEKNILCLLFYHSIISFCGEVQKLHLTVDIVDIQPIHHYTPEIVCKNLFPVNRTLEYDLSKIILPEKCAKLCTLYGTGEPAVECSMAYFFAQFNMNNLNHSVIVQNPENQVLNVQGQHAEKAGIDRSKLKETKSEKKHLAEQAPKAEENDDKKNHVSENITVQPHIDSESPKLNVVNVSSNQADRTTNSIEPKLEPNIPEVQNPQEAVEKPAQPKDTKSEEQALVPEKPTDLLSQQNSHLSHGNIPAATAQSTSETDHVQAIPNSSKGKLDAVIDENNDEKEEAPVLKPNLEEDEFRELEDDDSDPGIGNDPEQPPDDVQDLPAAPAVDDQPKEIKKSTPLESAANEENMEELDGGSYFFSYFMVICVFFVLGYVGYHNRIKVMALVVEGKRNKREYRGRRPNSANYHKLDSNLEEAISSTCTKNSNNVIY